VGCPWLWRPTAWRPRRVPGAGKWHATALVFATSLGAATVVNVPIGLARLVAIHAGGSTGVHARVAFVAGIHAGLLYAAGAAILAAISVATLLRREARAHTLVTETEQLQAAYISEQMALTFKAAD
jgi:hypothetical protein